MATPTSRRSFSSPPSLAARVGIAPILVMLIAVTVAAATLANAAPPAVPGVPSRGAQMVEQPEANIAYFLQISDATITLLPRLLAALWHPKNLYIVHFDRKIPAWQRDHAVTALFRSSQHWHANVVVLPSEPVTYRGISMVLNDLNAMQAAVDHYIDWAYFINISGSDYPLVSPTVQRRLLASYDFLQRNRSFISFAKQEWWQKSKEFRFDRLFTDTSLSFNDSSAEVVDSYADQPLSQINNFTFAAAEAWMILHRSLVRYFLTDATARRLLIAFSYSLEPEEHYFPTAVWNDPVFNATAVPHAMRHVSWTHNGKHAGQHPYYVDRQDENGTFPFRDSIEYSGCLFTRKIRNQDSPVLDYIDKHLNGRSPYAEQADVDNYLARVKRVIKCLITLSTADNASVCFPEWRD